MYKILTKKTKRSRSYERIIAQFMNIDEVIRYCKENNIKYAGTPYIFSHIKLSDGTIVTQEVMGMTCSPTTLHKAMLDQLEAEVSL